MSLKSLMNGAAIAAIATGTVLSGTDAASARDWSRGHDGGAHVNRWGEVRSDRDEGGRGGWSHDRGYGRGWDGEHHRDHTARNIAIGAFAAVLGMALAAESQRVQDRYYDERD